MQFMNESNETIHLVDISTAVESEYFWALDLSMMDYTLSPLAVLEETTCPTFVVEVGGKLVNVPAGWNMLIYDSETGDVDLIPLSEMTGRSFTALGYGPNRVLAKPLPVRIMDYKPYVQNIGPALNKHQMLCCPIDNETWFSVCASDVYTKYFKNITMGDILQ